jgi:hypothetical protein
MKLIALLAICCFWVVETNAQTNKRQAAFNLSDHHLAIQGYDPVAYFTQGKALKGEKVSVDPETFKIVNGKLFLFYNSFFNNTLKSWNKDENNPHARADKNWKKFF